jgi:hypothetical protein
MQKFSFQQSPTFHFVLQAIHGNCPEYIATSMARFALYYSSLFIVLYDHKKGDYVKASHNTLLHKLFLYVKGVFLTGAVHSLYLLYPNVFIQFGTASDRDIWYSRQDIFQWQRLWKNLCFASKCSWCVELSLPTRESGEFLIRLPPTQHAESLLHNILVDMYLGAPAHDSSGHWSRVGRSVG